MPMEPQPNTPESPITIPVLLARQLSDWQVLQDAFKAQNPVSFAVDYCQAQIDRLQSELDSLKK